MPKITFKGDKKDLSFEAIAGSSILETAMENRVPIYHTCGGNCSCSTCRVWVIKGAENLSQADTSETQVLEAFDLKAPHRLGCQALLMKGDVVVEIPRRVRPPRPNKTPSLPS